MAAAEAASQGRLASVNRGRLVMAGLWSGGGAGGSITLLSRPSSGPSNLLQELASHSASQVPSS